MIKPFIVFDFDGTIADTFTLSPHGINVPVAYDFAVGKLFGENGTRIYYDYLGGLQNREPLELVTEITGIAKRESIDIDFDGSIPEAAEKLVQLKLACYIPEISPAWPKLFDDTADFFRGISEGTIPADVAIVSSGQDAFIQKTFEVNGLTLPKNIVTSDSIRHLKQPQRPLYKPNPYQLARAHFNWKKDKNGSLSKGERFIGRNHGKSLMMFIGDDHVKDGGLAERSKIPYGHVPHSQPDYKPNPDKGQILITDFNSLRNLIEENIYGLQEVKSLSAILFGKTDMELFPPLSENERPYAKWLVENGIRSSKERF